ncbi:MAG: ribosome-associated heat shock protein Hsp15 [Gammaproteobacteria bacterium]|nr:ribosome-associated heat shock protein Hsp15 [Gammaproteobacteria bacterium]
MAITTSLRVLKLAKSTANATQSNAIRLDKWLWAARFYKTRAIAKDMIQGGKVTYQDQRSRPSKTVEIGAKVKLRQGNENKEVVILALSGQRGPAPVAQALYQETIASIELRDKNAELRRLHVLDNPHPERRPDKKQRRKIIQFKAQ